MSYTATWKDQADLNENEINKLSKDGLKVFEDLDTLCQQPFSSIPKSYYMYFKYAGLTVQKPQEDGLFMLRVKIPWGIMTARQAKCLAWLGETYGKGIFDLTTRQSIQCHWVPFHALPQIFYKLKEYGLTTSEAEGDTPRNIISNPLMGIDPDELFDISALLKEVNTALQDNTDYTNLPRKFKISISSNIWNAANAQIQDLAFTPASKSVQGNRTFGFHVYAGGGLGGAPVLGQRLNMFVEPRHVLAVIKGALAIYRDYGYRNNRKRARLKVLIKDWGIAAFEEKLRASLDVKLLKAGRNEMKGWNYGMCHGIQEQKQAGLYTLAIRIRAGRLTSDDLKTFAEIAEEYGNGELRIDHSQNLLIPNIAQKHLETLQKHPLIQSYGILDNQFSDFGISCTGNEFCNMAFVNTKDTLRDLLIYLDQTITMDVPIRIIMNGCTNNCGHRSIADIGLLGIPFQEGTETHEAYQLSLGGSLDDENPTYTKAFKGKIRKENLSEFMKEFLLFVQQEKRPLESFFQFYQRIDHDRLQSKIDAILHQLS